MPSIHFKALKDHAEAMLADARAEVVIEAHRFEKLIEHIVELGIVALGIGPEPKPEEAVSGDIDMSQAQFAWRGTAQPGLMTDGSSSAGVSSGAVTAIDPTAISTSAAESVAQVTHSDAEDGAGSAEASPQ
jgi:hypothetical protein